MTGRSFIGPRTQEDDTYSRHVVARLFDFFSDEAPWPRRLWDAGAVLALKELADASAWVDAHVLGSASVNWLGGDLSRILGKDSGIGDKELRQQLQVVLRSDLVLGGRTHRQLRQLTEMIEDGYLQRWTVAVHSGRRPAPERVARAVAAHLLDMGYSPGHLRAWIRDLANAGADLTEILGSAQGLATGQIQTYDVLVPFTSVPGKNLGSNPSNWKSAPDAAQWLRNNLVSAPPRHNGGFLYRIRARDPYAAAIEASEIVDRLMARSTFANRTRLLVPVGKMWVSGLHHEIPLRRPSRGTFILSLETEGQLFHVTKRTALDNALELATDLNTGSPGPAISGGWSAIEALLVSPKDTKEDGGRGNVAAERMAALVACSWPRAEITALAHKHRPETPDRLSAELEKAKTNRERSGLVAEALRNGRKVAVQADTDIAAAARMTKLVAHERSTLRDVERHVTSTMRRFYRHRNIVMHGGATNVQTLAMALRTAAPLVGAGLDRITHAAITGGLDPLMLSTRARTNLDLVGGADGRPLTDLLE
ncbi:integrase [Arthrobacter citreus]|uniref:integrase n=1 Tax=Arthrobacter citreus TaxID=1670 RepID=UPI0036DE1139